ncbi:MAG: hypothetical protein J5958_06640 [Clostridia bacterium]|nr:hypothetical protein [Clostridia bacterium]
MIQYCRYCANAVDYYGDGASFVCTADAHCGRGGAGEMYSASKAKRPNKCPHFEFNENDVFSLDENGNFRTYKPRGNPKQKYEQIEMEITK